MSQNNQADENIKCGFVGLVGRPNVGKSSIMNALIGKKISIVSPIPQTTRHSIKGILNVTNTQLVFVDTPGMHSFKETLAHHLNAVAKKSYEGCDLILYVVDVSRKIGEEEEVVMDLVSSCDIKVIMALNKMDLGVKRLNDYVNSWQEIIKNKQGADTLLYFLPVSAKTGKNIDKLRELLVENAPVQHQFYDLGVDTDFPLKFRIADIIREKLFLHLSEELPHSLAVEVTEVKEKDKVTYIKANIFVNRVSQRKIVIGRGGSLLKNIGKEARKEIEVILNRKVYLDTFVKVLNKWQENSRILKELGYWWT